MARRSGTPFNRTPSRGLSSVGRALPLQGRCQEFESPRLHKNSQQCRSGSDVHRGRFSRWRPRGRGRVASAFQRRSNGAVLRCPHDDRDQLRKVDVATVGAVRSRTEAQRGAGARRRAGQRRCHGSISADRFRTASRAPWPIWGHWAAILTVWHAAAKRAFKCRSNCLAIKRRARCLKAPTLFFRRSLLARMKRAGTRRSNLLFTLPGRAESARRYPA